MNKRLASKILNNLENYHLHQRDLATTRWGKDMKKRGSPRAKQLIKRKNNK